MFAADVESVLRCRQCNKPFDKQSTLKRHGYYCRSRRGGSTIRPRSCISCARGKASCDNMRPNCSRCIAKSIECNYPANTTKATGPRTQYSDDVLAKWGEMAASSVADSSSVDCHPEGRNNRDTFLNDGFAMPGTESLSFGEELLDWDNPEVGFAELLNPQMNDLHDSPGSLPLVRPSTDSTNQTVRVEYDFSFPNFSLPTAPSCAVRSLIQRPELRTGPQRIANLILHTLKSYPLMMLRHKTLPPFIHRSLISSDVENAHMEPLTNCIGLVHMISGGVLGSRKLFWKNVQRECEHLSEVHLKLSKWELLAAMQALSIYILIRLDEGETDHNNFDVLLIKTVTIIAQQLNRADITCHAHCALCNDGLEMGWKEWIFRESRRRLAVVYRVVNMLIYFEPVAMCDMPKDLILAPLPARKQLWEACDEFVWKAESHKEPGIQTSLGLAADGELVKLDEGQLSCSDVWLPYKSLDTKTPSRSIASWEEWCSGLDGFGGLVMLAASLIV